MHWTNTFSIIMHKKHSAFIIYIITILPFRNVSKQIKKIRIWHSYTFIHVCSLWALKIQWFLGIWRINHFNNFNLIKLKIDQRRSMIPFIGSANTKYNIWMNWIPIIYIHSTVSWPIFSIIMCVFFSLHFLTMETHNLFAPIIVDWFVAAAYLVSWKNCFFYLSIIVLLLQICRTSFQQW